MKKVIQHYSYFPKKTARAKHAVVDLTGQEVIDVDLKARLYGLYMRFHEVNKDVGNYDGADIVIYDDNSVDLVIAAHINGAKKKEEPEHVLVRMKEFAFTCCRCGKKHVSNEAIAGFDTLRSVPKSLTKGRDSQNRWEYFCHECE